MNVINKAVNDIRPYERNPRKNSNSVATVAESIKRFGFLVPIVIDRNGVIVAGHTRYKAAISLGLSEVPCVIADSLSEEQIKAFRLADNKVGEASTWDTDLLISELKELSDIYGVDMESLGFSAVQDIDAIDLDEPDEKAETKSVTKCTCPKCGFEFEV